MLVSWTFKLPPSSWFCYDSTSISSLVKGYNFARLSADLHGNLVDGDEAGLQKVHLHKPPDMVVSPNKFYLLHNVQRYES